VGPLPCPPPSPFPRGGPPGVILPPPPPHTPCGPLRPPCGPHVPLAPTCSAARRGPSRAGRAARGGDTLRGLPLSGSSRAVSPFCPRRTLFRRASLQAHAYRYRALSLSLLRTARAAHDHARWHWHWQWHPRKYMRNSRGLVVCLSTGRTDPRAFQGSRHCSPHPQSLPPTQPRLLPRSPRLASPRAACCLFPCDLFSPHASPPSLALSSAPRRARAATLVLVRQVSRPLVLPPRAEPS
jgi:hypothetical protein